MPFERDPLASFCCGLPDPMDGPVPRGQDKDFGVRPRVQFGLCHFGGSTNAFWASVRYGQHSGRGGHTVTKWERRPLSLKCTSNHRDSRQASKQSRPRGSTRSRGEGPRRAQEV